MHGRRVRDGSITSPPMSISYGRRRERVVGHRRCARTANEPVDHITAEQTQRAIADHRGAARRLREHRDARRSRRRRRRAPATAAARRRPEPQHHDPQRHRGDDQRREAGRDVALGEEEHRVRARQQAARRATHEASSRRPMRSEPPAPEHDRGHDRARRDEARRHREERRRSSRPRRRSRGRSSPR